MAGLSHDSDSDAGGTSVESDVEPGMPRWVKVSALVVGLVVALAVAVMLISGGEHGPGRHTGDDASPAAEQMPPAGLEEHAPPDTP